MSRMTLHCPSCNAQVAPRIETNVAPVLERYTCPECKRTTLREELVHRRELRIIGGGPQGRRGGPSESHFVLRPSGPAGDQSVATYLEASGPLGTVQSGWTASLGEQHDTPIESISIYYTYTTSTSDQGPIIPTVRIQFRQGSGGTARNADEFTDGDFVGAPTERGPFTFATNQDGGAWTWSELASLQFQIEADVDDQGSQSVTSARLCEIRVEVVP